VVPRSGATVVAHELLRPFLADLPGQMELEDTYQADVMRLHGVSEPAIEELSRSLTAATDFLYLGRGINYPIALEGALKLKEISYIHAEGYPAAEMKHGPIALVDAETPSVFLAPRGPVFDKVLSNMQEVKARQGRIIAVTNSDDERVADLR